MITPADADRLAAVLDALNTLLPLAVIPDGDTYPEKLAAHRALTDALDVLAGAVEEWRGTRPYQPQCPQWAGHRDLGDGQRCGTCGASWSKLDELMHTSGAAQRTLGTMLEQRFIGDALLRTRPDDAGSVTYYESADRIES